MIDYLSALIFGFVQGATEFLPISSSGHLLLLHKFINLPNVNELAFDVSLHLATFLAVFWYYWSEILKILKSWFISFTGKKDKYSIIAWQILIATIPAAIIGFLFQDLFETFFRSASWVALMLVIVGVLFIIFEKISTKKNELASLTWRKSFLIGLAQIFSLIPGTSRSGITIISGLACNIKREEAIKFSFLLSLPIILGAVITKAPKLLEASLNPHEYYVILFAFFSALITGFLVIKYFLKFARNHSLNIFAYYRFVLAGIILLLLWL